MAIHSVTDKPDMTWQPSFDNEMPADTFGRKLAQAESLACTLYGAGGESFRCMNEVIQDNVLWLLGDLITEARIAHDAADKERQAKESEWVEVPVIGAAR